jgi:hypothetical protein
MGGQRVDDVALARAELSRQFARRHVFLHSDD